YIYVVLTKMERSGLLRGKWRIEKGRRKHIYTITEFGITEFKRQQKASLDYLIASYIHMNFAELNLRNIIQIYSKYYNWLFKRLGVNIESSREANFILSIPYQDSPLCNAITVLAISEAFPYFWIYLVNPPEIKFHEEKNNLVIVKGWRDNIPLKDCFADYLHLIGSPKTPQKKRPYKNQLEFPRRVASF
ncbi:MAG: PadR family transcriptional regulator, partial [Aigarchaeota archaeon]|nr:PadR family transcriptional regulator [Candidatus Pelearchaeum maunauluense]